jgi:cell division protein FtsZ
MFEVNEAKGNLKVACIGKTAEIWNKQSFAKEYELLEGNPLDSAAWENVDIGFLLADAERNEDVTNLKKAVAAAKDKCIPVLIPILISTKPVNVSAALLTINPENYVTESEIYKSIYYAMKSINDIACLPGLVNLDIQDIMSICKDKKSLQFYNFEILKSLQKNKNTNTKKSKEIKRAEVDISNIFLIQKPLITSIRGKILKNLKKRFKRPIRNILKSHIFYNYQENEKN